MDINGVGYLEFYAMLRGYLRFLPNVQYNETEQTKQTPTFPTIKPRSGSDCSKFWV